MKELHCYSNHRGKVACDLFLEIYKHYFQLEFIIDQRGDILWENHSNDNRKKKVVKFYFISSDYLNKTVDLLNKYFVSTFTFHHWWMAFFPFWCYVIDSSLQKIKNKQNRDKKKVAKVAAKF